MQSRLASGSSCVSLWRAGLAVFADTLASSSMRWKNPLLTSPLLFSFLPCLFGLGGGGGNQPETHSVNGVTASLGCLPASASPELRIMGECHHIQLLSALYPLGASIPGGLPRKS